jgi:hypothetical protein
MVRPRVIICPRERLAEEIIQLKNGYYKIKIFFEGSKEHSKANLQNNLILIKAFQKRG